MHFAQKFFSSFSPSKMKYSLYAAHGILRSLLSLLVSISSSISLPIPFTFARNCFETPTQTRQQHTTQTTHRPLGAGSTTEASRVERSGGGDSARLPTQLNYGRQPARRQIQILSGDKAGFFVIVVTITPLLRYRPPVTITSLRYRSLKK